jgi:hypothetical protein
MHITRKDSYENVTVTLITHDDKEYSNSIFKLICTKSRKINDNGSVTKWSDLNFRFEITNKDMKFGSIGNYRCVNMNKSDFLSWLMSLQQAVSDPNLYVNKVNVKRRIDKNDLILKFAVSEKMNRNAVLLCIMTNQSSYSKIGIDGLLFNQYLLQLGKMAVDILNFEMNFDSSILMYKNNQNVEYQSTLLQLQFEQNTKIIELLSNLNLSNSSISNHIEEVKEVENDNFKIEVQDNIEQTDSSDNGKNNDKDILDNILDIDDISSSYEFDEETNDNDKSVSNINDEFTNDLNDNIKDIKLEKLFGMRQDDIDNPKEIDIHKVDNKTTLIKFSELNGSGIELFSDIFTEAQQSKSILNKGIDKYFDEVLGEQNYYLPECVESDYNSLIYLSQIQFSNILVHYNLDEEMPNFQDIPLFYRMIDMSYEWKYDNVRNIHDLIAIYVYMHKYSKILKTRLPNAIENKEVFTRCFRLMYEPLYMTYLISAINNKTNLAETIFNHYSDLNKIDFFEDWNSKASELEIMLPTDNDIKSCIQELLIYVDNIKNVSTEINHMNYFHKGIVKLPYKNNFNQEHIFDIVKLEVYLNGMKNLTKQNIQQAIVTLNCDNVNDDVLAFLCDTFEYKPDDENKVVLDKLVDDTTKVNQSALYRYVSKYLPDDFENKDILMSYIGKINGDDLALADIPSEINIHTIPDNILISMVLWKPSEDIRIKQFSHLLAQVKNYWRTKSDIITDYMTDKNIKNITEDVENSADWGAFV